MSRPKPTKDLRVIRLNPPKSRDYFVEILGLPKKTQKDLIVWVPVRLALDVSSSSREPWMFLGEWPSADTPYHPAWPKLNEETMG